LESIKRFVEPGWKVIYMAVVTATKRNDLLFLSVLDFLGYRSSFTNYGKQENNFKTTGFFLVLFWTSIFLRFQKYITYLYPAHNNANNVFNGILVGRFYTSTHSHCLDFPVIAFIGYTVLATGV
jgi:hypothetical protein